MNTINNNRPKHNKLLTIILFLGFFTGLAYLSYSKTQEAKESERPSNIDVNFNISQSTKDSALTNFINHLDPVFKWNLEKKWQWQPFRAGNDLEIKEIKNLDKTIMEDIRRRNSILRKLISREIAVTIETHLLPDPRLSQEALDDFTKFWRQPKVIADITKMRIKYMASLAPRFNAQETQVITEARKFFSDTKKMEAVRQIIKEAKSLDDLINSSSESLISQFIEHLIKIEMVVYSKA